MAELPVALQYTQYLFQRRNFRIDIPKYTLFEWDSDMCPGVRTVAIGECLHVHVFLMAITSGSNGEMICVDHLASGL